MPEKYNIPESNSSNSTEGVENLNQAEKFEYFFFPDERQRMLLGEAVERVVDTVAESNNIGVPEKYITPNVIFLDKSARPLSTLFKDLWRKKFSDSPDLHIGFLNFGREIVNYDKEKGDAKIVNTNSYYLAKWADKVKKSFLKDAPQGSTITLVDDIKQTGATENGVINFLKDIFPSLQFRYIALTNAYENGRPDTEDNLNNLELFESKREVPGLGTFLSKKPPWAILKQGGEELNGLTGVMDEGDSFGFHTRLTALPYRKHEYFSPKEREEREGKYFKNKEMMETVLNLINEFSSEIILWEPNLTKLDFDEVAGLKECIKSFKEESRNLFDLTKHQGLTGYELFPGFVSFADSFTKLCDLSTKANNQNIKTEVFGKLGIEKVLYEGKGFGFSDVPGGNNILVYKNSVAEKIIRFARIMLTNHRDIEYRFDKQSIERRIDELVPQLRNEMHHITDEYLLNKQSK